MTYKWMSLDDYQGQIKMLTNGNFIRKTPVGTYQIYDGETLQAVPLDFNYGSVLEVKDYPWDKYDAVFAKRFQFRQYVGLNFSYSQQTNQYILLYCLSPYYDSTIEQLQDDDFELPLRRYYFAVFDESGELVKRLTLPLKYQANPKYDTIAASKYTTAYAASPEPYDLQNTITDNIWFSKTEASKILLSVPYEGGDYYDYCFVVVDLESKTYFEPTTEYINRNFSYVNTKTWKESPHDFWDFSSQLVVRNAHGYVDIVSATDNSRLHRIQKKYPPDDRDGDVSGKNYAIMYETRDKDGVYYAIIARDF